MQRLQGVRRSGLTALTAAALMLGAQGAPHAERLDLSTAPLFLKTGVAPNLIITLDDSGSMDRDYMPDTLPRSKDYNELYFYSTHYNGMAYDPAITYIPPVNANGQPLSTTFIDAWDDGFVRGDKDDLRDEYLDFDVDESGGPEGSGDGDNENEAFYAVWDPNKSNKCSGSDTDNDCYDKIIVPEAQQENFANWYSFYRTRRLATITGTTLAFADFGAGIRIGWQRLNTSKTIKSVEPFTGTHRTAFYSWLFDLPASGSTPLRAAQVRVGEYYKTDQPYNDAENRSVSCRQNYHVLMTDGLWNGSLSNKPGNYDGLNKLPDDKLPDGTDYTPRVPFKDGTRNTLADLAFKYWATDLSGLPDNVPLYMPQQGDSADANYWNPRNDPANWQHMVTYTVSLGLSTALTEPAWGGSTFAGDGYAAIAAGDKPWPAASSGSQNNAYDLWHAAINSRGQFFSADDPKALGDAFKTILDRIADRISSGTSVAVESGSIKHSNNVYIARFNSRDWTGQVVAYKLINDGDIGAALWDAACALTGGACTTDGENYTGKTEATRHIVTWNPQSREGVSFAWDKLAERQQDALDDGNDNDDNTLGKNRLLYLRGARDMEQQSNNDSGFRKRRGLLGDVVDATPVYVGPPDRFYPDGLETKPYSKFKSDHSDRAGVVYVGANDGMLHAFSAADGKELFAYVPSAVYAHLSELTDPDYSHRFYVDGTPTEGDAFFNNTWHTVLVGGLRAGGQGIYALDITDPSTSTSEANVATKVLWEFTDADDSDLGYTYSQPQIVRLHNGEWAAVFGNGYNSASGHAVLYVVNIADGSLIKKIDTQKGTAGTPNGLATVTPADTDGDGIVDYLYAGDLLGNLWKFDVSNDKTKEKWGIAHDKPLFTAVRSDDVHQPITTAPSIRRHPTGKGYLLMFGTGKYLEGRDAKASDAIQSVYGIWDRDDGKAFKAFTRANLLEQVIKQATTVNGTDYRVLSDNPLTWYTGKTGTLPSSDSGQYLGWYMDLKVKDGPALGEMQVTDSLVRGNRLIFTTLIPNDDPCSLGGDSWLMVLDYRDGGRFNPPVFDTNNDGIYDLADLVEIDAGDKGDDDDNGDDTDADKEKVSVSGQKSSNGILQTPALTSLPDADRAYLGGSDGKGTDCAGQDCTDIGRDPTTRNRQSWRQLR